MRGGRRYVEVPLLVRDGEVQLAQHVHAEDQVPIAARRYRVGNEEDIGFADGDTPNASAWNG